MKKIKNTNKNSGIIRSYTIQSNKSTSYKSSVTNNMINSVINLFQTNKNKDKEKEKTKEKEKNSTIYNNNNLKSKSEITLDKGKHLCPMYWCDEHLGINSNEPAKIRSNNLRDIMGKDSSNNISRYSRISNQTNTKCSSCNII
jgi:hypothetical protein